MDAAKASRDMLKFLDAIYKVVKTYRNCMDTQSAPLSRVRRFARRARTNRNVLEQVPSKAASSW